MSVSIQEYSCQFVPKTTENYEIVNIGILNDFINTIPGLSSVLLTAEESTLPGVKINAEAERLICIRRSSDSSFGADRLAILGFNLSGTSIATSPSGNYADNYAYSANVLNGGKFLIKRIGTLWEFSCVTSGNSVFRFGYSISLGNVRKFIFRGWSSNYGWNLNWFGSAENSYEINTNNYFMYYSEGGVIPIFTPVIPDGNYIFSSDFGWVSTALSLGSLITLNNQEYFVCHSRTDSQGKSLVAKVV